MKHDTFNSKYHSAVRQFKTFLVTEEIKKANGNMCKAAASLGLHRNTVNRLVEELGIDIYGIKRVANTGRSEQTEPKDESRPNSI